MATVEMGPGPNGEIITTNATPTICAAAVITISAGEVVHIDGKMIAVGASTGATVLNSAVAVRSADGSTLTVHGGSASVEGDSAGLPGLTAEWIANGNTEVVPRVTGVAGTTVNWICTSRYSKRVP